MELQKAVPIPRVSKAVRIRAVIQQRWQSNLPQVFETFGMGSNEVPICGFHFFELLYEIAMNLGPFLKSPPGFIRHWLVAGRIDLP